MPRSGRISAGRAQSSHAIQSREASSDMHSLQGIEMEYCISILENFSRSILASAISVRQDTEAFFAVSMLRFAGTVFPKCWSRIMAASFFPTTPGGYVRSSASRKRRSKKENPIKITEKQRLACRDVWPTGALKRRRRGKTRFSAHDKWMRDYNFQKHMAH